ncbi:DUF4326 domain-containing protein [Mycobacterium kansasii]|uniref:DUF4326 domain-containing protein n=1 Tax=Mycobacterium kansasii TaxID=1768 RepID=UPI0009EF729F|nr:DUF4326 domain-containing protein [Mycobacterium kansasii]ARG91426.1 hypothetical protein B1T50_04750 [Mycobacterium kansasii]
MPERIQLRRVRGWRKPEGAIVVARPSRWGNPFTISGAIEHGWASTEKAARALAADAFRDCLTRGEESAWWSAVSAKHFIRLVCELDELRGRDLACWCPVIDEFGQRVPCHADVLLEVANA